MSATNVPLAITMGDANGVGPEILLRYFSDGGFPSSTVVYGDMAILESGADRLDLNIPFKSWRPTEAPDPQKLNVFDFGLLSVHDLQPGKLSKSTGAAAYQYIKSATEDALDKKISGIVTLPINKLATQMLFPTFRGHTDSIAVWCDTKDYAMMLATEEIAVSHVSAHVSLAEAIRILNTARIETVIDLTRTALSSFVSKPRIAVCGLNPHAGEQGLMGYEDEEIIKPVIDHCQNMGWQVSGPHPADTIFHRAIHADEYDGIICMYHDQGHAPMKLFAFQRGVNVTIGLPIVRTSVDHGTAFDIAWKGIAFTDSLAHALEYARKMVAGKQA